MGVPPLNLVIRIPHEYLVISANRTVSAIAGSTRNSFFLTCLPIPHSARSTHQRLLVHVTLSPAWSAVLFPLLRHQSHHANAYTLQPTEITTMPCQLLQRVGNVLVSQNPSQRLDNTFQSLLVASSVSHGLPILRISILGSEEGVNPLVLLTLSTIKHPFYLVPRSIVGEMLGVLMVTHFSHVWRSSLPPLYIMWRSKSRSWRSKTQKCGPRASDMASNPYRLDVMVHSITTYNNPK